MASGALPPGFPAVVIEGEHYWDGGISSNTPLDFVLDEETDRDLLIFQVDLFSARGRAAGDAAGGRRAREGHPLFQPHADEHRQEQADPQRPHGGARPDRQAAGLSERTIRRSNCCARASHENTVTVVHLIYKQQELREQSSKDYDFSHVAMVEHWEAGVRDVH